MVALVAVFATILLPAFRPSRSRSRANCVNNLKQIGTAFRMYANDYDGKYPSFHFTNQTWQCFQSVGEYLQSPSYLLCPDDQERPNSSRASDFNYFANSNSLSSPSRRNQSVSYFYGADASPANPDLMLAGDRNLAINHQPLSGWVKIGTRSPISWTKAIHQEAGNIVLADGSVSQGQANELRFLVTAVTNQTQRLIFP